MSTASRRILLIAYEFLPSPSPQSLRWIYLSRELSRQGHDVHVLTIDLGESTPGLPELPDNITIHRTHPGPFRGLIAARRKKREAQAMAAGQSAAVACPPTAKTSRTGWKHRVSVAIQGAFEFVWFPDLRGEWFPAARRELRRLMNALQPDLVISSHEPATTLQLGLIARHEGTPWVVDLGDPVLAPYTHRRWRWKARSLEARVCNEADHVLVTAPSARELLLQRHAGNSPITVLTQGYDDTGAPMPAMSSDETSPDTLELLYTGSFYRFRRADALINAVLATPGTRLNIASISVPDAIVQASQKNAGQIRLLGFLPHLDAIRWQRQSDVLINLANLDPVQVPGKCYEYLGSGRPILHLGDNADDETARLILERRRGWTCPQQEDALTRKLRELVRLKQEGRLTEGLSLGRAEVAEFGWTHLGARLGEIIGSATAHRTREPAPP